MFIHLGIMACIVVWGSNGQESCLTPSWTLGICIEINDCGPILKKMNQLEPLTENEIEDLRGSRCGVVGNNPKVCCPLNQKGTTQAPTTSSSVPLPPDVTNHPKLRLLNDVSCGSFTADRIIGGNKTKVLEFPWMALIAYSIDGKLTGFKCGGSLVNKRYVLTAGHCVSGLADGVHLSGVRIGEHDLSKELDCDEDDGVQTVCAEKYQNFFYEKVHIHSGYLPSKTDDDIALIRLDGDVDFGPLKARPICLPIGNDMTLRARKVIVTGWGVTETGFGSQELLQVKLRIVGIDECSRSYREGLNATVTHKHICARSNNGGDSCWGDSGGPLQYPVNINGVSKYVQYGIVSFGTSSCADPRYPGVYTNVVYYMDWILDTIDE